MATKVLVIGMLVALVIAIIIYYRIKLPSFAIEIVKDRYERTATAVKTARKNKKTANKDSREEETRHSTHTQL